jgi:predicted lipoprotein with Yx(FWY)xxD motif
MKQMQHRKAGSTKVMSRDPMTVGMVVALTAVLGVIGFLAASSLARSAPAAAATVSLRKTGLGPVLVNSKGRTIYLFLKDKNGKSACNGACARFWPPLLSRGKPTVGAGLKASLLGTTMRSNGSRQVTYNRHPLYTFMLDKRAGQTNGEGNSLFGAKWYVVSAKGRAIVKAPATTTSTSTPTTTTPYPYP